VSQETVCAIVLDAEAGCCLRKSDPLGTYFARTSLRVQVSGGHKSSGREWLVTRRDNITGVNSPSGLPPRLPLARAPRKKYPHIADCCLIRDHDPGQATGSFFMESALEVLTMRRGRCEAHRHRTGDH
jgi:hypothetical protein